MPEVVCMLTGYYPSISYPLYIITYEKMKFIESEAAFSSGNIPQAYGPYIESIKANMNKMGIAVVRRTYRNDPSVSAGKSNLAPTLTQKKNIKHCFSCLVGWDDARRFDCRVPGISITIKCCYFYFCKKVSLSLNC